MQDTGEVEATAVVVPARRVGGASSLPGTEALPPTWSIAVPVIPGDTWTRGSARVGAVRPAPTGRNYFTPQMLRYWSR